MWEFYHYVNNYTNLSITNWFQYFECVCLRCCDPKELNTYLSALKCLKCPVGHFLPTDTLEDTCEWCCEDCGAKVPNEYAVNVNEQVAHTIQVTIQTCMYR